jgi:Rieske Fe-S protein
MAKSSKAAGKPAEQPDEPGPGVPLHSLPHSEPATPRQPRRHGHEPSEAGPGVPLHSLAHTEPAWEPERGPPLLTRRGFIKGVVGAAIAGALVSGTMAQLLPAVAPSAFGGGGKGAIIVRDPKTNAKLPFTLQMLAGEPPVEKTAEFNFLPASIFKVKKSILEASSRKRGYNTAEYALEMPGEPDNAIVVYEGKCKHLGCTVGWNAGLGGKPDGRILCPCHQGQYDIYDLALNVPGTPPPSPLNVVEFDVTSWTDDSTGTTYQDVLVGQQKVAQEGPRQAKGKSLLKLPADVFTIRQRGWSA